MREHKRRGGGRRASAALEMGLEISSFKRKGEQQRVPNRREVEGFASNIGSKLN